MKLHERTRRKKNLCHLRNLWFHLPIFFVAKIRRLAAALFGFGYLVVGWRLVKHLFKTFGKIRGAGKPHLKSHFQHTPKIIFFACYENTQIRQQAIRLCHNTG